MATITGSRAVSNIKSHTIRIRAGDVVTSGHGGATLDPTKLNVRTRLCTIPANAVITEVKCVTPVAFNDPTATLQVSVGTATTPSAYLNGINLKTTGNASTTPAGAMAITTAATPLYLKCIAGAAMGTTPSTVGEAVFIISYTDICRSDEVMLLGADATYDAVQQ